MRDKQVRRLPVIEKGEFKGLVTLKDILKVEPQLFELLAEKFELRETEKKPITLPPGTCEECGKFSDKVFYTNGKTLCRSCRKHSLSL